MEIKLDPVCTFLAGYLSWAWQAQTHATLLPTIIYRGHASAEWSLAPSLARQRVPGHLLKQFEWEIINEFRNRFNLSDWKDLEILAYARHHGAPTRLLDWSRNPFVGLWFAVAESQHDSIDGLVFQLVIPESSKVISIIADQNLTLQHVDECEKTVHIIPSPHRIERTERQRSIFTIASLNTGDAPKHLDTLLAEASEKGIRQFRIPFQTKREVRRLLAHLGLDAYSMYGDPDSFGKSLTAIFDMSGLNLPPKESWPGAGEDKWIGSTPSKPKG